MEKIYMEENKSQNNSNKGMYRFSIVLSFAVAIFAMVTLGMVGIVINQGTGVSYAAPVTADNFALKFGKRYKITGETDTSKNMYILNYYAGSVSEANRVYCIERYFDAVENATYAKGNKRGDIDLTNDAGLVYLLNIDVTKDFWGFGNNFDDDAKVAQGMMVQAAIWKYLAAKYNAAPFSLRKDTTGGIDDAAVMEIDAVTMTPINSSGTATDGAVLHIPTFKTTINSLVSNANAATLPNITVNKESDDISLTEDKKYYQSAAITVVGNPSSSFTGYDAALAGIDGAFAVDENGNELTLTNVAPSKKFYVRIPAEKVTKTVQTVTINATGHFSAAAVQYYVNDDSHQRLASVKPGSFNGGGEVEFVGTDDTGMNTAQTIYFIGLIVLLCGVGIVYANARPVESKQ